MAQQEQGRTLAQSGQRVTRRSRRQIGQIPDLRRLEGCFGHFQISRSSTYRAICCVRVVGERKRGFRFRFCTSVRFSRFLFRLCGFRLGNAFKRIGLIEGDKLTMVNLPALIQDRG
ncbi:hypothetical protein O6P43_025155 [Quillaja saponaria]|uniref:Uncharacterized protein n=1 Tax=Quillaja saponaria TaxID=32244 RepID=A0AAD7L8D7_QUISA|nr:hypothetical protein O6P43_025155 [Quillaja saponaria]